MSGFRPRFGGLREMGTLQTLGLVFSYLALTLRCMGASISEWPSKRAQCCGQGLVKSGARILYCLLSMIKVLHQQQFMSSPRLRNQEELFETKCVETMTNSSNRTGPYKKHGDLGHLRVISL